MSSDTVGHAAIYKPTIAERLWCCLGFRYHLGEDPEGTDGLEGWSRTDTRLHFGWVDRLRLLTTGRLMVSTISHYDTPSPSIIKTRVDWKISAPGERS